MSVAEIEELKKAKIIIAVAPAFLNQKDAGHYLGKSGEWLRLNALRHDLYKPSTGESRRGAPSPYHIEHLDIIADHMLDKENFTADLALDTWKARRQNKLLGHLEAARTPKKGKRK